MMADSDTDSEASVPRYNPKRPYVTWLNHEDGSSGIYTPIHGDPEERVGFIPSFAMPDSLEPSPASLNEVFLPDSLLARWAKSTNAYAKRHAKPEEEGGKKPMEVDIADILRFIAFIMYTGVVRLPNRVDYFRSRDNAQWPWHHLVTLTRAKFLFMWRYFHMTEEAIEEEVVEEEDEDDSDDEEDERGIQTIDDDISTTSVDSEDEVPLTSLFQEEEEEEQPPPPPTEDKVWYHKVEEFVNWINKVSQRLCRHPGSTLSIDEMMKRFKGRSKDTHRMKHKPIKEGFKFWALCDSSTGYCYSYFPAGRWSEKTNIKNTVMRLVETIPRRDVLKYIVTMDNYFTLGSVLAATREANVGVIGTARNRRGDFPPPPLKAVTDKRFNTLYLMNDKTRNFLVGRWLDNSDVLMVSTVHTGEESIARVRRRPRENAINKSNIKMVWGSKPSALIKIPKMIDDYNHWMGGVDRCDQLISYYRSNLRCRRTWMPMFLHCIDIMRVNCFVIVRHWATLQKRKKPKQKDFVMDLIETLNTRATAMSFQTTRTRGAGGGNAAETTFTTPPPTSGGKKRCRIYGSSPQLPACRFTGTRADHCVVIKEKGTQIRCTYCAYLSKRHQRIGTPDQQVTPIRRVRRSCHWCKEFLCKEHFGPFHGWEE